MDWNDMARSFFMKAILGCTALALAIAMATLPANAKGCIKGAIIGGAAGHVACPGWARSHRTARAAVPYRATAPKPL